MPNFKVPGQEPHQLQAVRLHILQQRRKETERGQLLQRQAQEKVTVEQCDEEIAAEEARLVALQKEKHDLFLKLKLVLHQEDDKKKKNQKKEMREREREAKPLAKPMEKIAVERSIDSDRPRKEAVEGPWWGGSVKRPRSPSPPHYSYPAKRQAEANLRSPSSRGYAQGQVPANQYHSGMLQSPPMVSDSPRMVVLHQRHEVHSSGHGSDGGHRQLSQVGSMESSAGHSSSAHHSQRGVSSHQPMQQVHSADASRSQDSHQRHHPGVLPRPMEHEGRGHAVDHGDVQPRMVHLATAHTTGRGQAVQHSPQQQQQSYGQQGAYVHRDQQQPQSARPLVAPHQQQQQQHYNQIRNRGPYHGSRSGYY